MHFAFFRVRKQEALLEEMERQRLHEEEYFKVTQKDVENLRKQDTLGKFFRLLQVICLFYVLRKET